jgi:hypothetical protein
MRHCGMISVAHEDLLWRLEWTIGYHKRWGMSWAWTRVLDTRGLRFMELRHHTSCTLCVRWWPKETNETTELIGFMPMPHVIKTHSDRECKTSRILNLASRMEVNRKVHSGRFAHGSEVLLCRELGGQQSSPGHSAEERRQRDNSRLLSVCVFGCYCYSYLLSVRFQIPFLLETVS